MAQNRTEFQALFWAKASTMWLYFLQVLQAFSNMLSNELLEASWMTPDFLLFLQNKYVSQKKDLLKEFLR